MEKLNPLDTLPENIKGIVSKRLARITLTNIERAVLSRFVRRHSELREIVRIKPKPKPIPSPKPVWTSPPDGLKGYFAGLLDGEGTPSIIKVKGKYKAPFKYYEAVVSITNTVREPLELLKKHYSGCVSLMRKENRGPTGKVGKPLYVWAAMCYKAYIFLKDTYPYLIIKRNRAEIVMRLQERIKNTGQALSDDEISTREQLFQECKKL